MSFFKIWEFVMLFFGGLILVYMLVVVISYGIMLLFAFFQLRRQYKLEKQDIDEGYIDLFFSKPISIIVPAFNEEVGIINSIHSLLSLRYPQTELIIVNDGSTDGTQQEVIKEFKMVKVDEIIREQIPTKPIKNIYHSEIFPHLWLVEKENGGKADALNVGINFSNYPYFCSVDGDSILDEKSLLRVMKPIILGNGDVIGAGGNVRIANGTQVQMGTVFQTKLSKNYLVVMQVVEYMRAFLMGRMALSTFNLILIISGAFSVFSKKHVVEVGGYSNHMIGEDMELVVKLHRYLKENKINKRIEFVPDPVCWTEAPESLSVLRQQRRRWHQGLIESMTKHRKMSFNFKYGRIGLISFPLFWIVECLGPLIELGGYIYVIIAFFMGDIYYEFSLLLILLFVIYGTVFSVASILLEAWAMNTYPKIREVFVLMLMSLTEIFWYRPLTLIWRCEGFIQVLLKRKDWGSMNRVGLSKKGI
ncbi:glycosyltransferase family 2 protein [Robertmurraya siralis]|uniref:glycosyltransferase family 2 protein n=1 Tax=Robertmurraya siralis TaxID=77777 RepID=UPI0010F93563|nr:glycosyltransferase [Robertmurraya siralis]